MSGDETQDPKKDRANKTTERYLAFSLADEHFALPLLAVQEVIEMTAVTPLPQTPPYFRGLINLRGQVVSVLDLRAKLQMPKGAEGPKTAIIILDLGEGLSIGVVVDRVISVLAFQDLDVSPPPDQFSPVKQHCISGIARSDNRLVVIMDIRKALSLEDFKTLRHNSNSLAA